MTYRSTIVGAFEAGLMVLPAHAQTDAVQLADYLASMDRTAVSFSGQIRYNTTERDFTLYDVNREPFGVTMDAGRDVRERVETGCGSSSFMFSYSELCTISGSGTVEIRGSRVFISIEVVDHLGR